MSWFNLALLVTGALGLGILVGSRFRIVRGEISESVKREIDAHYGLDMRMLLGWRKPICGERIEAISPEFVATYNEATLAEHYKLTRVCGVAYGRALEFLVKDFAKTESPGHDADIERATLANCISRHITEPTIRDSADLARWLRNEEAHYRRTLENRDVKDLKTLIALTVALMNNAFQQRDFADRVAKLKQELDQERSSGRSQS